MGFSTEFKNRLQYNQLSNYEILVFIKDSNGEYVDFSDRIKDKESLLTKIGTISYTHERTSLSPAMITSLSQINMDNSTGFWDQTFPTLTTEEGNTADFEVTKGSQLSVVEGRYIQFRIKLIIDEKSEISNLLTMRIKNVITNNDVATLYLESFSQYLKSKSAAGVRDRNGWYQNKPISFLVRELLKTEFVEDRSDNSDILPLSFVIPSSDLELTDPDNVKVYSVLGRPPVGVDTDDDNIPNEYHTSSYIPRYILGGTAPSTISSSAFSTAHDDITHLYIACNHRLYAYSIENDSYKLLDSLSSSNYNIRKLWYNTNDSKIWGIAFSTLAVQGSGTSENVYTQDAIIFSCTYQANPFGTSTYPITEHRTITAQLFNDDNQTIYITPCTYFKRRASGRNAGNNEIFAGYWSGKDGTNIPILFSQFVKWDYEDHDTDDSDSTKIRYGSHEVEDLTGGTEYDDGWVPRGYIACQSVYETGSPDDDVFFSTSINFSMNQDGFSVLDSNNNNIIVCTLLTPASDFLSGSDFADFNETIKITKIDLDSTIYQSTDINNNLTNAYTTIGSLPVHPSCGCANEDDLWICGVSFSSLTTQRLGSAIMHIDLSSQTYTTSTLYENDSYDNTFRVFLECIHYTHPNTSTEYLITITCYPYANVANAAKTPLYMVEIFNLTLNTIEKRLATYVSQPYGLIQGETLGGNAGHYIYFNESSSGALKRIDTTDWSVSDLNNNKPITETEFSVYGNMVFDTNTDSDGVIWGISHPNGYIEESQDAYVPLDGKYNLFKYHIKYYPLIELADFSGLNIWDALSLLAQKCYHSIGFDESGNFYMCPKDISSNDVDYTLDDQEMPIQIISKNRAISDIANVSKIIPNIVTLQPPEFEGLLVNEGEDRDANTVGEDEIQLRQEGTKTQQIKLFCARGGDAIGGDDTYRQNPLFKYLVYENVLEVRVTEEISETSTNIYLTTVYGGDDYSGGVHTNDFISIESEDSGEIVRRITGGINGGSGTINFNDSGVVIDSAFGDVVNTDGSSNFKVGSTVKVYKRFKETQSSTSGRQWSDEGVTYVVEDPDWSGQTSYSNDTEIYVQSVENLSINTVVQIEGTVADGTAVYERRITDIDTDNNKITLDAAIDCFAFIEDDDSSRDVIVKAFWSPKDDATYYAIGGTGVGIIIDSAGDKAEFKVGDVINITCPGLKLEADNRSPQIAYSVDSIARYGEREHKEINNRFLNRRDGEFLSRYVVNAHKFPHYILTVQTPYLPFITNKNDDDQLTKVAIKSKKAFPVAPNYQVKGYIRRVTHDPHGGKSTFVIKSEDFY